MTRTPSVDADASPSSAGDSTGVFVETVDRDSPIEEEHDSDVDDTSRASSTFSLQDEDVDIGNVNNLSDGSLYCLVTIHKARLSEVDDHQQPCMIRTFLIKLPGERRTMNSSCSSSCFSSWQGPSSLPSQSQSSLPSSNMETKRILGNNCVMDLYHPEETSKGGEGEVGGAAETLANGGGGEWYDNVDSDELLELFDDVINGLAENVKRSYYIARETIPDIVAEETNPRKFLLGSNGNLVDAAQRLANYWHNRNLFFGDRWLLPMTQTGMGCLSFRDVEQLRTGYITLVTLSDQRQFLVSDASRLRGSVDPIIRDRVLYYYATVGLNDKTYRDGLDHIVLVNSSGFPYSDNNLCQKRLAILLSSLPATFVKSLTTVPVLTDGKERLVEYLSFLYTKTLVSLSPKTLAGSVAPCSTWEALQLIKQKGFPRSYLPEKVGGSPLFESQFADFIRMRISIEDAMSSALPERNILPTTTTTSHHHEQTSSVKPNRCVKGLSLIIKRSNATVAKDDYVRKRNAMYTRRRAQKIKMQHVVLQSQKEILERENKSLKMANNKLELALSKVHSLLVSIGPVAAAATSPSL